jgi:hypothetical protein
VDVILVPLVSSAWLKLLLLPSSVVMLVLLERVRLLGQTFFKDFLFASLNKSSEICFLPKLLRERKCRPHSIFNLKGGTKPTTEISTEKFHSTFS